MKSMKITNSLPKYKLIKAKEPRKRNLQRSEFQQMLDVYMNEAADDLESYSLSLPKNGNFWDDGYKDVAQVS
jgi:hypothetical protein